MVDEQQQPKRNPPKQSEIGENRNCLLSPRFRSVAAMAGWDEEALLMASVVVEDTPDRNSKPKRRSDPMFKSPPAISRRKRRDQRKSPVSKFVSVLEETLDVDVNGNDNGNGNGNGKKLEKPNESSSGKAVIPCIDRLREELSCAICLEICFEPSTTPCGHSFCKKCLKSAADKCGRRCPKCRQLISNGKSCTINTVLWNTIQLLFPEEIEARKAVVGASKMIESVEPKAVNGTHNRHYHNLRQQSFRPGTVVLLNSREAGENSVSRRIRGRPQVVAPPQGQDEDAALALRLQREEFMGGSVAESAFGSLRAMASRIINTRRL